MNNLIVMACMAAVLIAVVLAFFVGLTVGRMLSFSSNCKTLPEKVEVSKKEVDKEAIRRAERIKRETENMLSYSGTPQEPIDY